jgi:hypothetical protein
MKCDACQRAIEGFVRMVIVGSGRYEMMNGYGGLIARIVLVGDRETVTCVACEPVVSSA